MPSVRSQPLGPSDFGVDRFTVPAVLDRRAEQYPDRVMMSIYGTDVTFEQMRRRSCAAANLLIDLGVRRGDPIDEQRHPGSTGHRPRRASDLKTKTPNRRRCQKRSAPS